MNAEPPTMKCKCCGIEFDLAKKTYHNRNITNVSHIHGQKVTLVTKKQISKKRYCSKECRSQYMQYPDEFGYWWKT